MHTELLYTCFTFQNSSPCSRDGRKERKVYRSRFVDETMVHQAETIMISWYCANDNLFFFSSAERVWERSLALGEWSLLQCECRYTRVAVDPSTGRRCNHGVATGQAKGKLSSTGTQENKTPYALKITFVGEFLTHTFVLYSFRMNSGANGICWVTQWVNMWLIRRARHWPTGTSNLYGYCYMLVPVCVGVGVWVYVRCTRDIVVSIYNY